MARTVNTTASNWQTRGRAQRSAGGLGLSIRERIRQGKVPESIQELIGPLQEEDIDTVIDILETLKGEGTSFEDLTPSEKRAFARAYLERTGERRSGLGGGVFVVGALAVVGGLVWWQSTRGQPPESASRPQGSQEEKNRS